MRSCRLFSLLLTLTALCQTAKAQFLGGNGQGAGQVAGTTYRLLDGATVTPQAVQFVQHPANTVAFRPDVAGMVHLYTHNDLLLADVTPITISIQNNPGSASILGTTSISTSAGVASFSALAITRSGTGYTLAAAATGATSGVSQPFDVSQATLELTQMPPVFVETGATFPIRARITDGTNVLTLASTSITLALSTNPTGAT
ncbi:MAG: hypothetical protein ACK5FT_10495, partial [Sphingomonadales bacterium]